MNKLEKDIFQIISDNPGIKGKEIAYKLDKDTKEINTVLSKSAWLKKQVAQDNSYKWSVIGISHNKVDKPKKEVDPDLSNLCNYYLECIGIESVNSVSQFLTSNYELRYAVLRSLNIDSGVDNNAISLLGRINNKRDSKACLGYPIYIYTIMSRDGRPFRKVAPIFMFPVEYDGGAINVSWDPSINPEVLKNYTDGGSDSLASELLTLETDLGLNEPDADIEVDELVLRLKEIRDWEWKETIDPYNIPTPEDISNLEDGIYNRPILIEADKTPYTEGLETELAELSKMSEDDYKDTALHDWIKLTQNEVDYSENHTLLEVLPLNLEQSTSVEKALNSNLTIITGPPGTGKSQVVTDLLINIVWKGQSALFSSKNNKAVDVVDSRVNSLSNRPVLLRIGSFQNAKRLAEIIEGLLNVQQNHSAKDDLEYYSKEYKRISEQLQKSHKEKDEYIKVRNELDELEQKYCPIREEIGARLLIVDANDIGEISSATENYKTAFIRSVKEEQGALTKMFWSLTEKKRIEQRDDAGSKYSLYAKKYDLRDVVDINNVEDVNKTVEEAKKFDSLLPIATSYKNALNKLSSMESLEKIDEKLYHSKEQLAKIAGMLWDTWLNNQAIDFSPRDRMELANYVAAMKLSNDIDITNDRELKKKYSRVADKMTGYLKCWAVTSLSAKSRVPFSAGMFDYVIIDEASQCDIASVLPLLYRAKKAVIIGDPMQLRHISELQKNKDAMLLQKYNVEPLWSYSVTSLYDLASAKVNRGDIIQLKDHFRSCADIIEYSNRQFYDKSLRIATNYNLLKVPKDETPGIRWIDVKGETKKLNGHSAYNAKEIETVVNELARLVNSGYVGTIGVATPFRAQAERIVDTLQTKKKSLYNQLVRDHDFIADTVHKFQGDERDVMIFSSVVSSGTQRSTLGFLKTTGNIFNVAITRARAILVVVGDYSFCRKCDVEYLSGFAEYYDEILANQGEGSKEETIEYPHTRKYPQVANPEQVSDWEKIMYVALFDAGIETIPQYPADKYKLDLAIVLDDGRKLDIEIDGEMYHRSWNGELCYRDQIRNQRLFELGWDVKRFWVYQIRDELRECISAIKDWVEQND